MNKTTKITIITVFCTILGFGYYAWQQHWIIVNIPSEFVAKHCTDCSKKKVTIFYFRNKWEHEATEIVWSKEETQNAQQLVQAVLSLLTENSTTKKVTIEQVISSYNNQYLFIFFDKSPLPKNISIHAKLMVIESILKTLRDNNIKTPNIYFLVNNQPLPDAHLDFSIAWPLQGFAKI